jgi:DNA-binding NarL/FixJ family response regulator
MGGRVRDAAYFAGGLAEDAHAAADVAAFHRALLHRLTSFIGADSASLIPMPQPSMLDRHQTSALLNIEKHYYSRFADNCTRYWRAAPAFVARLVSDGVVIDTDVYSTRERERLEPYVEVLIPAGITSILCTPLAFQSRATTLMCLNRHDRARPFLGRDTAALRLIGPLIGLVDAAVLARGSARANESDLRVLTPREREVAMLVQRGLQNKEIGSVLGTSAETVRKQTCAIYRKLRVAGRVAAPAPAPAAEPVGRQSTLTPREAEIVKLVCRGLTNGEIAGVLGNRANTVRNQLVSIFKKLDVASRAELAGLVGIDRAAASL